MSQCERQHLKSNGVTIPSQTLPSPSESTQWTEAHNKAFEEALAMFPDNHPNLWDEIVKHVPGAWSPADMKMRYEMLKGDCFLIESGIAELPTYSDNVKVPAAAAEMHPAMPPVLSPLVASKKGAAWTEEEHKLFLLGLEQYGRGDWKSIARNFVISRTPGQVASHAQKYFLRQNASKKARKRSSIHDITIGDESNQNLHHNHNLVLTPDVAMQQLQEYQLQELQQAQQMLYSNPPNNLPNGFGNFNSNCF